MAAKTLFALLFAVFACWSGLDSGTATQELQRCLRSHGIGGGTATATVTDEGVEFIFPDRGVPRDIAHTCQAAVESWIDTNSARIAENPPA